MSFINVMLNFNIITNDHYDKLCDCVFSITLWQMLNQMFDVWIFQYSTYCTLVVPSISLCSVIVDTCQ